MYLNFKYLDLKEKQNHCLWKKILMHIGVIYVYIYTIVIEYII